MFETAQNLTSCHLIIWAWPEFTFSFLIVSVLTCVLSVGNRCLLTISCRWLESNEDLRLLSINILKRLPWIWAEVSEHDKENFRWQVGLWPSSAFSSCSSFLLILLLSFPSASPSRIPISFYSLSLALTCYLLFSFFWPHSPLPPHFLLLLILCRIFPLPSSLPAPVPLLLIFLLLLLNDFSAFSYSLSFFFPFSCFNSLYPSSHSTPPPSHSRPLPLLSYSSSFLASPASHQLVRSYLSRNP